MELNAIQQSFLILAFTIFAVVFTAQQGWLGPYGQPGDTLHLIILTSVIFFTWLIFHYTIPSGGEE